MIDENECGNANASRTSISVSTELPLPKNKKNHSPDLNYATDNNFYNEKTNIRSQSSHQTQRSKQDYCLHSPQPPHVSVLVGEKAVRVIAAVLEVTKAAAEKRRSVAVCPGARESRHQHVIFAPVALARRAHHQPMQRARDCLASLALSVKRWVFPFWVPPQWRSHAAVGDTAAAGFRLYLCPPSLFCLRFISRSTTTSGK